MMFIYIIGIILCICLMIFIVDKIQSQQLIDHQIQLKKEQIIKTDKDLDHIITQLDKSNKILSKIDSFSKKLLKLKK